jgi:hypothetical protein
MCIALELPTHAAVVRRQAVVARAPHHTRRKRRRNCARRTKTWSICTRGNSNGNGKVATPAAAPASLLPAAPAPASTAVCFPSSSACRPRRKTCRPRTGRAKLVCKEVGRRALARRRCPLVVSRVVGAVAPHAKAAHCPSFSRLRRRPRPRPGARSHPYQSSAAHGCGTHMSTHYCCR